VHFIDGFRVEQPILGALKGLGSPASGETRGPLKVDPGSEAR
jgi:hypothetical protein